MPRAVNAHFQVALDERALGIGDLPIQVRRKHRLDPLVLTRPSQHASHALFSLAL
jgi:hypothetical protein